MNLESPAEYALTSVPMQKRFAAEHCCEVFCDTLEHFLGWIHGSTTFFWLLTKSP